MHATKYLYFLFPSAGHDDFDFAYYLARNNLENEGVKCKVCSQQIGKYCQVCLPAQFSHEEHVKLKLSHPKQPTVIFTQKHCYVSHVEETITISSKHLLTCNQLS